MDKKNHILDFWNALNVMFLRFRFFLTRENLILSALKQKILDEIKQSNCIKPPKIHFFMILCKFLPHKPNFCWKVPSKMIYTFYLTHRKYPFCAPNFHPVSETESCIKIMVKLFGGGFVINWANPFSLLNAVGGSEPWPFHPD